MTLNPQAKWPAILILVAMFATGVWLWPSAPAIMPIHWNAAGEVDGYSGKFAALFLIPAVATALYLFFDAAFQFRSAGLDVPTKRAIGWFKYALLLVMVGVYAVMAAAARGVMIDMNLVAPPLIALMLLAVGNLMFRGFSAALAKRKTPGDDHES